MTESTAQEIAHKLRAVRNQAAKLGGVWQTDDEFFVEWRRYLQMCDDLKKTHLRAQGVIDRIDRVIEREEVRK